jgi:DNA-binding GntR family transcriptional regulator
MLDAIAGGDEAAIVAAVRGHLSGTAAQLQDLVARFPEYF